ncbi:hypothetical protein NHH03_20350 [Stieleria sp. TO1_6]|uniref:hypothetical protein n=1 Tax=Stieleria tagensis TaxID=2956795 RepID=UPI00209AEFC3|nr:hypothetical protein [Stieleria tagensis]MCO8124107.1 hypothetical protein [Stieleria tagensis]
MSKPNPYKPTADDGETRPAVSNNAGRIIVTIFVSMVVGFIVVLFLLPYFFMVGI